MITEDDLSYYYSVVETLWLGGANPTLKRIRNGIRPVERDSSHLAEGLAELVARRWLKVEQIPLSPWRPETVYETWYVPIRDHHPDTR